MIKLLIFDFDGTLVDTRKSVVETITEILARHGYKTNKRFLKALGDGPLEEILRIVVRKKGEIGEIAKDIGYDRIKKDREVKANAGLLRIKDMGIPRVILTNSISYSAKNILKYLKIRFFREIYGAEHLESKESRMRHTIRKHRVKPEEVIYVDDKPVGIKMARKVGCVSVAISNKASWSTRKELIAAKPDFIISNLGEIKEIVRKLNFN